MQVKDLNPQAVWSIFDEITKVPRPSGNEEGKLDKIRAWLVDFAKKHNLEYKIDKTGNVAIFRPAVPARPTTLTPTPSRPSSTANGYVPTTPRWAPTTVWAWLSLWLP